MDPTATRRIIGTLKRHDASPVYQHLLEDLTIAIFGPNEVDGLDPHERECVKSGAHGRIEAIKSLRNRYKETDPDGRGTLVGAKDAVDAYISIHGGGRS